MKATEPGVCEHLGPEVEEGNVEFKYKLVQVAPPRLNHLVTQMNWRLNEGNDECFYEIGVRDDGTPDGLDDPELQESIQTLHEMASNLPGCTMEVLRIQAGYIAGHNVAEVLVRRDTAVAAAAAAAVSTDGGTDSGLPSPSVTDGEEPPPLPPPPTTSGMTTLSRSSTADVSSPPRRAAPLAEIRLAVAGHAESGKTTLVSVLTNGDMDNGRGLARMQLFRHEHEVESGRTSSINYSVIGFDSRGSVIVDATSPVGGVTQVTDCRMPIGSSGLQHATFNQEAGQILLDSAKILTFMDLCGQEKFLKTTMDGLVGQEPDYALLTVAANPGAGVKKMTQEHLGIALALNVPLMVVITKVDIATERSLAHTLRNTQRLLNCTGREVLVVRSEEDLNQWNSVSEPDFFNGVGGGDLEGNGTAASAMPPPAPVQGPPSSSSATTEGATPTEPTADGDGNAGDSSAMDSGASSPSMPEVVPIFLASNVSGHGLPLIKRFLSLLPARAGKWDAAHKREFSAPEVHISETFAVEGVGTVVAGTVYQGECKVGDRLLLGPDRRGLFAPVEIRSVHSKRLAVRSVRAGQNASFALRLVGSNAEMAAFNSNSNTSSRRVNQCRELGLCAQMDVLGEESKSLSEKAASPPGPSRSSRRHLQRHRSRQSSSISGRSPPPLRRAAVRKGMVLVAAEHGQAAWEFEAEVLVLSHNSGMTQNYTPIVHVRTAVQAARLIGIRALDGNGDRNGDGNASDDAAAPSEEDAEAGEGAAGGEGKSGVPGPGTVRVRTGERAWVRFHFVYRPEYIREGSTLLVRDGGTKAVGKVVKVKPIS